MPRGAVTFLGYFLGKAKKVTVHWRNRRHAESSLLCADYALDCRFREDDDELRERGLRRASRERLKVVVVINNQRRVIRKSLF